MSSDSSEISLVLSNWFDGNKKPDSPRKHIPSNTRYFHPNSRTGTTGTTPRGNVGSFECERIKRSQLDEVL
jgi:hypothetical protein